MKVMLIKPYPGDFVGCRNLPPECFEVGWTATLKDSEGARNQAVNVGKEYQILILEDNKWSANFPAECFTLLNLNLEKVLEL